MKNSLYVIAGLLMVIWGILYWGFKPFGIINILPAIAIFLILVRIIFSKKLSEKRFIILRRKKTDLK